MDSTKCCVTLTSKIPTSSLAIPNNAKSNSICSSTMCVHSSQSLKISNCHRKIQLMQQLLLKTDPHLTKRQLNNDHRLHRNRQASSCIRPTLATHEDHCQLHSHCSWFHRKCLCSCCSQIVHLLQLPRFPSCLQTHSRPSFSMWVFGTAPTDPLACKPPSEKNFAPLAPILLAIFATKNHAGVLQ